MKTTEPLFYIDPLSLIMMSLVAFVAATIASFSARHLKGDRKQATFYFNLAFLVLSVFIMICSNHVLFLLGAWCISNFLLTRLMLHKREWEAARQSARLAFSNYLLGFIFLTSALFILYSVTGETSIQAILRQPIQSSVLMVSGLLIFLAAMTQSALWPFHKWLTSSANSPTPASAIMHAGLVNGGGFLLARFAPMLLDQTIILNIIFVTGITTAMIGTIWKLLQSDVKRMLACSTMSQMGFMIAQCGLGLFPAAIAHLCWHGLFKSYLFLGSGSAAKEKRLELKRPASITHFVLALICGVLGAFTFSITSGKSLFAGDTTLFLILLAMIGGTQFALTLVRSFSIVTIVFSLMMTALMGAIYGGSVYSIGQILKSSAISNPQPLNAFHVIALVLLATSWLAIVFSRQIKQKRYPDWMLKFYVSMLNASQPHPRTVTANRNLYKF